MAKNAAELNLRLLKDGLPPGVTPVFGAMTLEAGSVVLEHNGHRSGVAFQVETPRRKLYVLRWPKLHRDARAAHNDMPEAAHYGAYGIAFLLAVALTDFKIIERTWKGPGFDYWLGTGDAHPFQKAARLEVSGIVNDPSRLNARVNEKKRQTDRSKGRIPAFVAVIEFGEPKSIFEKR